MSLNSNKQAKSLCKGCKSILDEIEDELLKYISELREQGESVSIKMVETKALSLLPEFREKTECARYNAARRFVRRHGFTQKMLKAKK